MAIINALLGDEVMSDLSASELTTLEAKVTRALIGSEAVHKAIASEVKSGDFLEKRRKK